jgi:hypothetical protein
MCTAGACGTVCATDDQCRSRGLGFFCEGAGGCGRGDIDGDILLIVRVADGERVVNPAAPITATVAEDAQNVALDASDTVYIGRGGTNFSWTVLDDGDTGLTLSGAERPRATFNAPQILADTEVLLRITVTNDAGTAERTAQVAIVVQNTVNEPPTVSVTATPEEARAGEEVVLDASATSDPNGDALAVPFLWAQTAGPAVALEDASGDGSRKQVRFTAPALAADDSLSFQVTVSDTHADPKSATAAVTVLILGDAATGCRRDADCADEEDDDLCTGTLICNVADGTCVTDPASVVVCQAPANPCLTAVCVPATGLCSETAVADGTACDAQDRCHSDGECLDGVCVGTPITCDDGNACTASACDPAEGCRHPARPDGAVCDDGDACTENNTCVGGVCGGTPIVCDDGNPCTDNTCDSALGCVFSANTDLCDDGDACTTGDQCVEGECVGTPVVLDTSNPCVVFTCDPATGISQQNVDGPCDDGNPCTLDDGCVDGRCVGGTWDSCDDDNVCTAGNCNPAGGGCEYVPIPGPCDDGDACTIGDECSDGECRPGRPVPLDDSNPCVVYECDPEIGVYPVYVEGECDDNNPCTRDDRCLEGRCIGTPDPALCPCETDEDCVAFDDENLCSGSYMCDEDLGFCVIDRATVIDCDRQHPPTDCARHVCVPATGECVMETRNEGDPCDDGDACTRDTLCEGGACVGGQPRVCDDGNPCTDNECDPESGCFHPPNTAPCDDGNACTRDDRCANGRCEGIPVRCESGDPCLAGRCDPAVGCVFDPLSDTPCDTGNPCTRNDTCVAGVCAPGASVNCDNGNPCTVDTCDPAAGGCVHTPTEGAPCDTGNLCTTDDRCSASGVCMPGNAVPCPTDNPCLRGLCDPAVGCQYEPRDDGTPCDDDDICTVDDRCVEGRCVGGGALECVSENPCLDGFCSSDVAGGCYFEPVTGRDCDDGDPCTADSVCREGECVAQDYICDCDPDDDRCEEEDGNRCNGIQVCEVIDGLPRCVTEPGTVITCDPSNDTTCARNRCVAETGECVMQPRNDGRECDDGNPCTLFTTCQDGVCAGGENNPCDDGNSCTEDGCDPAVGCINRPRAGEECDDGDACTVATACDDEGRCVGRPRNCDDGNPCTTNACDPASGCTSTPLSGVACNDGNACTVNDTCVEGVCQGTPRLCDDRNPCTDNSCDPSTGCVFTPNTAPCDNGLYCTVNDVCRNGQCASGPARDCNDQNPCTNDSCNERDRTCVNDPISNCCVTSADCPDDGNPCTYATCLKFPGNPTGSCMVLARPAGYGCTPATGDFGGLCDRDRVCQPFVRRTTPTRPLVDPGYALASIYQSTPGATLWAVGKRGATSSQATGIIIPIEGTTLGGIAHTGGTGQYTSVHRDLAVGTAGMAFLESNGWRSLTASELGLTSTTAFRHTFGGNDATFCCTTGWILPRASGGVEYCRRTSSLTGGTSWGCTAHTYTGGSRQAGPAWGYAYSVQSGMLWSMNLRDSYIFANSSGNAAQVFFNALPVGTTTWTTGEQGCAGCGGSTGPWRDAHGFRLDGAAETWGVGRGSRIRRFRQATGAWQELSVPAAAIGDRDPAGLDIKAVFAREDRVFLVAEYDSSTTLFGRTFYGRDLLLLQYVQSSQSFSSSTLLERVTCSETTSLQPVCPGRIGRAGLGDIWVAETVTGELDIWVVGSTTAAEDWWQYGTLHHIRFKY